MIHFYRQYHPYPRFGAANVVTLCRAILTVGLIAIAAWPPTTTLAWVAGWTAGLIAALDGVDGWLARREQMTSRFGARFDMETDAALLLVLSVLAWRYEKAGPWVLLIGLMRYLFVIAGRALPWLTGPLTPTRRGRVVAVVQMVTLAVVLVVPRPVASAALATALALLVWSFAVDVRRLWLTRQ